MRKWLDRDDRNGGVSRLQWLSLLVVPLIILGLFAFAFSNPVRDLDQVPAAVVNLDEPVTVDGQLTPLGRELAASLVNADDPDYDWTLTNPEDADVGIASGHYRVVVMIPKEFSAKATSVANPRPEDVQPATIDVRSTLDAPLADAAIGRVLADAAIRSLGTTITENYLSNIYISLNTLHAKLSEAAVGAGQLAQGADDLKNGAAQLRTGSSDLADGLDQLKGGASQLASGLDQANSGGRDLASGAADLHAGSSQLSSGLGELERQTASLPSQAQALSDGARQVADGTQTLTDRATPALTAATDAIDRAPDASTVASAISTLVNECDGSPAFCERLRNQSSNLTGNASQLDQLKSDVRAKVVSAQNDIDLLNSGAHQVAEGNAALAQAAGPLAQGISDAAGGASQLDSGAAQLESGASTLSQGIDQLATGAHDLSSGANDAADGAHQLAEGARQLSDGAVQLADGTHTLADGLDDAVTQLPTYTDEDRDHLKRIVAAPIGSHVIGTDGYMNSAMALFAVIALWAGALIAFTLLRPMPRNTLISNRPTWYLALVGSLPGAALGAAQAVLVSAILAIVTGATLPKFLLILLATLVATATFMVLNRALVAAFKAPGRVVALVILMLALITGVTSAQPEILQSMSGLLPTSAALTMFRNAVGGAAPQTFAALVPLLFWLLLGYIATVWLTDRARVTPVRALRPPTPAHDDVDTTPLPVTA